MAAMFNEVLSGWINSFKRHYTCPLDTSTAGEGGDGELQDTHLALTKGATVGGPRGGYRANVICPPAASAGNGWRM